MTKRLPKSLALLTLLLSHSVVSEPLFWSASKGDKALMILGSIHMGKPEMYPLPDQVMDFLAQSDALITEINLSESTTPSQPIHASLLTSEALNTEQQAELARINRRLGYSEHAFLNLPAWQTAIQLQVAQFTQLGFDPSLGIDNYITEQAELQEKPIIGLETVDFQLSLFSEDDHTGQQLLANTVDNWEENSRISQCLADNWQAGDPALMEELALDSEIDEQLSAQFIYQRNHDWADKIAADSMISAGKYLVVVGALHLVGEQNLIELLEKRGFQVTQLSKMTRSVCD